MSKTVGVIGGLGTMATVYFFDMVANMTDAKCDQEHVDMIISNRASTPDRTDYIIGKSSSNPCEVIIRDVKKLESCGVDFIAMTCNTAHYFYEEISNSIKIPMLNIIEETVVNAKDRGFKKLGILATSGNIKANLYQEMCNRYDIDYLVLDDSRQDIIMDVIYNEVKCGKSVGMNRFNSIVDHLIDNGCDGAILGCTELSVLKVDNNLDDTFFIDSLEVLARNTIIKCGKRLK